MNRQFMRELDPAVQYGSTRTHGGKVFVLDGHGQNRMILDQRARENPGAFVTWEAQGLVLADRQRVGPRFALWVPYTPPAEPEVAHARPAVELPPPESAPERLNEQAAQQEVAQGPTAEDSTTKRARGPKTTRYKNITRIDHPPKRTYGYFVRVRWKGTTRSRFFSDKKYGDRLAALAMAVEWRDQVEQELGKPRTERLVIGQTRASNTGVVGVRRRKEGHTEYMEATWVNEHGTLSRTRFSVARYGFKGALRRAQKVREEHERARWRMPAPDEKG